MTKKIFKERTLGQIVWASKIILKKMCEIIKENQENGKGTIADGYIASLLLKNKDSKKANQGYSRIII